MALAACSGRKLMPTPLLYATGEPAERQVFEEVPEPLRTPNAEIFYATDRAPSGGEPYGWGRSLSLAFGEITVALGKDLTWDELVAGSTSSDRKGDFTLSIADMRELVRLPETPMPMEVRNGRVKVKAAVEAQFQEASARIQRIIGDRLRQTESREIYFYVHGFNVKHEQAAYDLAELWHFMGRPGVPIIYSWPAASGGLLKAYFHETESGKFTIYHLKQMIRILMDTPNVDKIHFIAHSRGTGVLSDAMRELKFEFEDAHFAQRLSIGQVVMLSADIDVEVAGQRLMAEMADAQPFVNTTLYTSSGDLALAASIALLGSKARIGKVSPDMIPPQSKELIGQFPGFSMVYTPLKGDFLGHANFLTRPEVSSDLILLLRDERRAGRSYGRPLDEHSTNIWEIPAGYPWN